MNFGTFGDFQKPNFVKKTPCEISLKIMKQIQKLTYTKLFTISFQDKVIFFKNSRSVKISEIGPLHFLPKP
jgi:hypothetical protein